MSPGMIYPVHMTDFALLQYAHDSGPAWASRYG